MKKVYYLSSCDTCKRILNALDLPSDFEKQEIKIEKITVSQLEEMKNLAGSYEALFSKRARLYKERGLKNQSLSEEDFKKLILEHYSFLKRPVFIIDEAVFVGNSKKTIEKLREILERRR